MILKKKGIRITRSNLKEGKILVLVDLHSKDRVSGGLSETTQAHLGIEEVHHRLLCRRVAVILRRDSVNGEVVDHTSMKQLQYVV